MTKISKLAFWIVPFFLVISLCYYRYTNRYDEETRAEMAEFSKKWDETHFFCMQQHQKWPTFWRQKKEKEKTINERSLNAKSN